MEEKLLRNLELRYPSVAQKVESYQAISYYELVVKTTDGERYLYDDEWETIRRLPRDRSEITSDDLAIEFGYNLRRLMRRRGIDQELLAEESGISQAAISTYINGKRSPTLRSLHKISQVLDCDIGELVCIK